MVELSNGMGLPFLKNDTFSPLKVIKLIIWNDRINNTTCELIYETF